MWQKKDDDKNGDSDDIPAGEPEDAIEKQTGHPAENRANRNGESDEDSVEEDWEDKEGRDDDGNSDRQAGRVHVELRRSKRSSHAEITYGDDGLGSSSDGEDANDSSDEEKYAGKSLNAAIPDNMILHPRPPRLGKGLVGRHVVFRWDTGWFHGKITYFYNANERQRLSQEDRDRACNFEVKYTNEEHFYNTPLLKKTYSCSDDAPTDSWSLCVEAPQTDS